MSDSVSFSLFDLKHTVESGCPLTFHGNYDEKHNQFSYSYDSALLKLKYSGNVEKGKLVFDSKSSAKQEITKRFRLSDNLESIYRKINTDTHVDSTIKRYRGMRVTLNDPWETTLCFIISQFNNVKRIRLIVKKMMDVYGEDITDDEGNVVAKSFPTCEDLKTATVKEIFACGTGFRAKYIAHAAEYCTNNMDLYKLNPGNYEKLKEELMEIQGVGDKVADCIALMGYGNLKAFPIDVHIRRSMERLYFKSKKTKIRVLHEKAEELWNDYRGYANQYLFHRSRMSQA